MGAGSGLVPGARVWREGEDAPTNGGATGARREGAGKGRGEGSQWMHTGAEGDGSRREVCGGGGGGGGHRGRTAEAPRHHLPRSRRGFADHSSDASEEVGAKCGGAAAAQAMVPLPPSGEATRGSRGGSRPILVLSLMENILFSGRSSRGAVRAMAHPLRNCKKYIIYFTLNIHQVVAIFILFIKIMMMFSVNFKLQHPSL